MKGGGHPPLHATTSHPVSGTSPASRLQDEGRGSSLGRNVQPPTSESSAHPPFPALSSLARPPSQGADGQFKMPLTSALKRPGHRRVFSESLNTEKTLIPGHMKGHNRAASKTDFILPHDHIDRERRSSVLSAAPQTNGKGGHGGHKR